MSNSRPDRRERRSPGRRTARAPGPAPAARRSVITGIGVIAPNGIGADVFWKSTHEGISVLDRVSREGCERLPLKVGGEVRDLEPATLVEERFLVQTDRFTHFAMAAADLALADARLGRADYADSPFSVGVVTASGSGGGEFGQRELQALWGKSSRFVGPYQSIAWFYAASTGQISIRGGFKGPCGVVCSDEAGGLDVFAHAAGAIERGTDAMIAGSAEAPLAPYSVVCQLGYEDLSTSDDPTRAYRPFTADACGFVPAEGGAMLVVEEESAALLRGARPRAWLAGHAATFTGPSRWPESREGLARAIQGALRSARCAPEEVDVVFADALGVPAADRAEALAITDALGAHGRRVPVTAPKTGIGRAYCGGPVLDVAAAVMAMEHGVVPPTPNVFDVCHDIDVVTGKARRAPLRTALVLSRGLMGSNSALVLRSAAPDGGRSGPTREGENA
ncbi:ketosynthase chain-length factor [Streptomyces katsurahamanus]|uniref:Ketosynthase chain-length factor n=1 Tax=Streptomyces katsurahamanus TaxID=2577098 RepID=A0ABW9NP08_9ACTN|nr:ketosynthase chain-length factor [Streptomyces katsurahamanus]MQS34901.1 ketosynthase chain-length factor [Streptomyces katsurahamanus]